MSRQKVAKMIVQELTMKLLSCIITNKYFYCFFNLFCVQIYSLILVLFDFLWGPSFYVNAIRFRSFYRTRRILLFWSNSSITGEIKNMKKIWNIRKSYSIKLLLCFLFYLFWFWFIFWFWFFRLYFYFFLSFLIKFLIKFAFVIKIELYKMFEIL